MFRHFSTRGFKFNGWYKAKSQILNLFNAQIPKLFNFFPIYFTQKSPQKVLATFPLRFPQKIPQIKYFPIISGRQNQNWGEQIPSPPITVSNYCLKVFIKWSKQKKIFQQLQVDFAHMLIHCGFNKCMKKQNIFFQINQKREKINFPFFLFNSLLFVFSFLCFVLSF